MKTKIELVAKNKSLRHFDILIDGEFSGIIQTLEKPGDKWYYYRNTGVGATAVADTQWEILEIVMYDNKVVIE